MAHRSFLFAPSSGMTPVFGLRREIDRLFEDAFGGPGGERGGRPNFAPPVDVREDEREILIQADLPGVQPDQVEISLDNGMLTVRGERRQERKEGDERRWHVMERTHGVFVRTFQLPAGVDESRIAADFDAGVLTIHVPKPAQPQPRRIEIEVGRGEARLADARQGEGQQGEGQQGEGRKGEGRKGEGR